MAVDAYTSTLQALWHHAGDAFPERCAVSCNGRRLTYAEARQSCAALATHLAAFGTGDALRVAVLLPNCLEYYLLYWAIAECAGIIIPVNPWLKSDSIDAILDTISPSLVILPDDGAPELEASLAHHPQLPTWTARQILRSCELRSQDAIPGSSNSCPPLPEARPEDIAIIMHTSGTTAAPKGAVMRHCDLEFNATTTILGQGFREDDVHLLVNPMFHCTALYSSLPSAARQGSSVIITAETQPEALLRLIQEEHITTCLTVPSILQRITSFPGITSFDLSSLRVIGYAGSLMPVKVVRALQRIFPACDLHNFFGLTETISATHLLETKDALLHPDSIGKLLPGVEALIVDEEMTPCADGQVGELLFARKNVIPCYYGKPGKLEEAFVTIEGRIWFRTGDLASRDAEGFFIIKGRKKEMIIVGGENVFASEVEAVILGMEEVREVCVKGIPATGIRESLGEMILATVVPETGCKLTSADVRRFCSKRLPSYKVPHVVEFTDALPRNASGKIIR